MLTLNKKIIITVLFIIINTFTISSLAVVSPTADFYVNDYAGLLDKETENYIINSNKSLYNQTGAQIVVVTVPSLESDSLEEYATKLFRNFGIGDKTKNNGLLLLLALEEKQFRVEVGYGLEGILPDAKTGRIQDEYIIPYLKQKNWNEGIKNGFSVFLEIVASEYNVEVGAQTAIAKEYTQDDNGDSSYSLVFMISVFSAIVGSICGTLKKSKVIKKMPLKIICVVYFVILFIVYLKIFEEVVFSNLIGRLLFLGCMEVFSLIGFLVGMISIKRGHGIGGFFGGGSDGGFSGGGFSGGGSSFRRRRFFRRRRKLKRFLNL